MGTNSGNMEVKIGRFTLPYNKQTERLIQTAKELDSKHKDLSLSEMKVMEKMLERTDGNVDMAEALLKDMILHGEGAPKYLTFKDIANAKQIEYADTVDASDVVIFVEDLDLQLLTKTDISILPQLENMKRISIVGGINISDPEVLGQLYKVEVLRIDYGSKAICDAIHKLGFKALKELRIDYVGDLAFLEDMQRIEKLDITITSQVADLSGLLKGLKIRELTLGSLPRTLYEAFTKETDISALTSIKTLRKLDVSLFQLSPKQIEVLKQMTRLEELILPKSTKDEVVMQIQQALPKCSVRKAYD